MTERTTTVKKFVAKWSGCGCRKGRQLVYKNFVKFRFGTFNFEEYNYHDYSKRKGHDNYA